MKPEQTIRLSQSAIPKELLTQLWGGGIGIRVQLGTSLQVMLCEQLGIAPDYLEHRIQTILVNSQAVDHVSRLIIGEGDTIALSAAMPGLAGTTLRKGGHLSAMRAQISQQNSDKPSQQKNMGIVTLKLFNMVAREIGPQILSRGILLPGRKAADFLERSSISPKPVITASSTQWVAFEFSSS